jgi:hypothetical protein
LHKSSPYNKVISPLILPFFVASYLMMRVVVGYLEWGFISIFFHFVLAQIGNLAYKWPVLTVQIIRIFSLLKGTDSRMELYAQR